nr:histidine kinase N-terminal 7TM domain-containing protein [Paenibacillus koleovorans]
MAQNRYQCFTKQTEDINGKIFAYANEHPQLRTLNPKCVVMDLAQAYHTWIQWWSSFFLAYPDPRRICSLFCRFGRRRALIWLVAGRTSTWVPGMTYLTISMAVKIISAAITALVGIYAYANRHQRGARYLAWVMLFETLNACGSIFEMISATLTEKLHWFNLHQSAHIFAIPFFLFFVLDYVGQERLLQRSKIFLILLYFILWAALLWTDSYHQLLRYEMMLQDGELTFSSTGLSVCLNIIGFMALLMALCYLGVYAGKYGPLARKQTLWVWLSVTLPIMWVIAGLVNPLPPLLWGLYTVVINGIIGVCMFLAVFKYKLLSTVPIAKDIIVEMILDGVLVADDKGAVIDSNASARRLFAGWAGSSADLAGRGPVVCCEGSRQAVGKQERSQASSYPQ